VADDDKEFDDGIGPLVVAPMLLPLILLFTDDEPKETRRDVISGSSSLKFSSRSYPFLLIVVVVLLNFASNFAAEKRTRLELGANSDSIDSRPGWAANTLINLEVDNILREFGIAFSNHLYLIPSSIRFFALFMLLSVLKSRRALMHCMAGATQSCENLFALSISPRYANIARF
jgi:hypothetical protein